jgi:hypothetical protein
MVNLVGTSLRGKFMGMNARARQVLDDLDLVLCDQTLTAREVWRVLSALRGPDANGHELDKKATTAIIRAAAFPRTAAVMNEGQFGPIPADMNSDDKRLLTHRLQMYATASSHFMFHARDAFGALALEWASVNNVPNAYKLPR